jgi:uncharacterized protein
MPALPSSIEFLTSVQANPINQLLLERMPQLGLPDAWLVAGCLFQTVWNLKAGASPTAGIRDYDIFYFDDADLSWEAENAQIIRVAKCFGDCGAKIELKNQARVHLWYGERFGSGYPQLKSACDGIDRFLIACTRVGVGIGRDNAMTVYAPSGLDDLYAGMLRPNPLNDRPDLFAAKIESYKERWPWLRLEGAS